MSWSSARSCLGVSCRSSEPTSQQEVSETPDNSGRQQEAADEQRNALDDSSRERTGARIRADKEEVTPNAAIGEPALPHRPRSKTMAEP